MSNGQRVDGDDMTYWWQALGDAGHFTVAEDGIGVSYLDSGTNAAPKLYGTMHNGEVKGVAIADVPAGNDVLKQWWRAVTGSGNGYDTPTPDKRLGEYLWHIASTITELNDKLTKQNSRITALEQRLDDEVRNLQTDRASLFESVRGIHFALQELKQRLDEMEADS